MDKTELLKARKAAWETAVLTDKTQALIYLGQNEFEHVDWRGFKGTKKNETLLRLVRPTEPEPVGLDETDFNYV